MLEPQPHLDRCAGFSGVGVQNWSSDGTELFPLIGVLEEKARAFLVGVAIAGSEEALIGSMAHADGEITD